MAIEAMQGQGIKGRAIKCGRPNNAPSALPYMEPLRAQAKANNRIFVANINPSLGQDDIKGVFEVFGEISMMVMPTMGGVRSSAEPWVVLALRVPRTSRLLLPPVDRHLLIALAALPYHPPQPQPQPQPTAHLPPHPAANAAP